MRPIAFRSPVPAMPTTSVENSSGAMIILIIRRKASASGLIATPSVGPEVADHDAEQQADEDLRGDAGQPRRRRPAARRVAVESRVHAYQA